MPRLPKSVARAAAARPAGWPAVAVAAKAAARVAGVSLAVVVVALAAWDAVRFVAGVVRWALQ